MAVRITYRYGGGNTRKLTIPNRRTSKLAKSLGWTETIPDPAYQDQLDDLLVEFHALDPNSSERATKGAEIQALQQAGQQQVANPISDEKFLIRYYHAQVRQTMIDQNAAQQLAQAALQAELERLADEAETDLSVEDTVEPE